MLRTPGSHRAVQYFGIGNYYIWQAPEFSTRTGFPPTCHFVVSLCEDAASAVDASAASPAFLLAASQALHFFKRVDML